MTPKAWNFDRPDMTGPQAKDASEHGRLGDLLSLVGGLEHGFYDFPYLGKKNPI